MAHNLRLVDFLDMAFFVCQGAILKLRMLNVCNKMCSIMALAPRESNYTSSNNARP